MYGLLPFIKIPAFQLRNFTEVALFIEHTFLNLGKFEEYLLVFNDILSHLLEVDELLVGEARVFV